MIKSDTKLTGRDGSKSALKKAGADQHIDNEPKVIMNEDDFETSFSVSGT